MKAFLEYIPLIFFLLIYRMDPQVLSLGSFSLEVGGIYSATAFLIGGTLLVYGALFLKTGSLTRMQWIVVVAVVVFGSSTLLLRSEDILKWKAPVVNWIIGSIFLGSQWLSEKNMARTMFGHVVNMPDKRWKVLNFGWSLVFYLVGTTNLFVAFTFPDYWVEFKVFGSMGMLLVATIIQMFYIYPYLETEEAPADSDKS